MQVVATAKAAAETNAELKAAHPFAGRIIFVTGRQGAGKTAVANGLAAAHGLVHLDGDLWSGQPGKSRIHAPRSANSCQVSWR